MWVYPADKVTYVVKVMAKKLENLALCSTTILLGVLLLSPWSWRYQ
jgi:hypothetical protein